MSHKIKVLKTERVYIELTNKRRVKAAYSVVCLPSKKNNTRTNYYSIHAYFKRKGEKPDRGSASSDYSRKSIAISKVLKQADLDKLVREAFDELVRSVLCSLGRVECRVRWFDKITGEGIVDFEGVNIPVYGCNILGAKTGYPHTACMDLVAGQTVTGELYDFGSHVSLIKVSGGIFDHEKWNKIKDQNLAFRKNADGEFTNGLFSNQIKSEIT